MTTVTVDTSLLPEINPKLNMLYFGSPAFLELKNDSQNIKIIAKYDIYNGAPVDK